MNLTWLTTQVMDFSAKWEDVHLFVLYIHFYNVGLLVILFS